MEEFDLSFLTLSQKYLHTSICILEELVKSNNKFLVLLPNSDEKEYSEATRWSDFNVILPSLFLFYHGLELVMKGLVLLKDKKISCTHDLEDLFQIFKTEYQNYEELICRVEKYVVNSDVKHNGLIDLLIRSNQEIQSPKKLYEALRYPTNKHIDKIYTYSPVKYKEEKIFNFVKDLIEDINFILSKSVALYNEDRGYKY